MKAAKAWVAFALLWGLTWPASGEGLSAERLWQAWPEERFVGTPAPCLRPTELGERLRDLQARHGEALRVEEVGRSVEGRPIHLLTLGHGVRKVLLWSQMHGDEPSATPALLDIAGFLLDRCDEPAVARVFAELTLLIVPMLNPDGAEVYSRRNAQGIDINRDALNLATPEGRLLKRLRDEHEPMLGFNLHDQNRRTAVGDTGALAANAVLAVAGDAKGTVTEGRRRAMRACAAIVSALAPFAPGGMARYDEDWSPRAFGDNLTAWGTPVVLLESGGLPAGRPFTDHSRLVFVALLRVLDDLARDDLAGHDPSLYQELERNRSRAWVDVAVRGGSVLQPGAGSAYRADLAFDVLRGDRQLAGCAPREASASRVVEVGDARFLAAGREIDATGMVLLPPLVVGTRGFAARRWLDGPGLERLARVGVGEVRWEVPRRRLQSARALAEALERPGRPRLEVVGPSEESFGLEISGPVPELDGESLGTVLQALGLPSGEASLPRADLATALWSETLLRERPSLTPGRRASFVLVRLEGERPLGPVVAVWLDGIEVVENER